MLSVIARKRRLRPAELVQGHTLLRSLAAQLDRAFGALCGSAVKISDCGFIYRVSLSHPQPSSGLTTDVAGPTNHAFHGFQKQPWRAADSTVRFSQLFSELVRFHV
jgi:hypothetical protein